MNKKELSHITQLIIDAYSFVKTTQVLNKLYHSIALLNKDNTEQLKQ